MKMTAARETVLSVISSCRTFDEMKNVILSPINNKQFLKLDRHVALDFAWLFEHSVEVATSNVRASVMAALPNMVKQTTIKKTIDELTRLKATKMCQLVGGPLQSEVN